MKRFFTSMMMLLLATGFSFAQEEEQSPVQFVDEKGNVIADGAVVNVTEGVEDEFGDVIFFTGVYVENISGNDITVGAEYEILSISNGTFQICFPENCVMQTQKGYYTTNQGTMQMETKRDMLAEWLPEQFGYGTCSVTLQVNTYTYNAVTKKYNVDEKGPKVTVNMIYTDPASVKNLENKVTETARYNVAGQKTDNHQQGINIIKLDNGKAVKMLGK